MLEIKQLQKIIPDLEAVILISHNGDLLDYDITKSFDQDYKSVENLKNLVSMRFRMGEFAELFGGLETTINKFNDKVMVSKSMPNKKIMILILRKNVNLEKLNQALHSL
ncbi:MAG: hypothetical protein IIA82_11260 [Thaumarchaeota archaeon]|nr:hypothetical protein [Nitrososphaerota archaeon]